MKSKCLYCYDELGELETDFHKKCCRKFFGTDTAPVLDLSLSDMEAYAVNLLQRSVSVTGVQPKLSVDLKKIRHEPARLTLVGLCGQYILKPPHNDYPEMPEIEGLTMKLAEYSGIITAKHSLIRLKSGELAYLCKRFDRTANNKLHVEDFAQLLEVQTERKYSGSVERIGKIILSYSSFPGNDLINLFELVLFCFLTGNADMHLKNYSLLRDEQDYIKLSPAYDLLATKLLVPKDMEEYAISINGKQANLRLKDFDKLSTNLGLNEKTKNSIYSKYFKIFDKWENLIIDSFLSEKLKAEYLSLISDRIRRIKSTS